MSRPECEDAFLRLHIYEHHWCDTYTGTAEDLIAAGLVSADQLPGQPGRNKSMCTYYDGQPVRQGVSNTPQDEWYVKIRTVSKGKFEVLVGLPEHIKRRRRACVPPPAPGDASSSASVHEPITEADVEIWRALRASPLGRRRPTARVIPLPGAAAEPVHQEGRPGRLPKRVTSLHDARIRKVEVNHVRAQAAGKEAEEFEAVLRCALWQARDAKLRGLVLGIQLAGDVPADIYGVGEWEAIAEDIGSRV